MDISIKGEEIESRNISNVTVSTTDGGALTGTTSGNVTVG